MSVFVSNDEIKIFNNDNNKLRKEILKKVAIEYYTPIRRLPNYDSIYRM